MRSGVRWDVAIVGGGIVGLSAALELQARGKTVIVVDAGGNRARASFGNAGVVNVGAVITVAGPHIWSRVFRYAANRDPGLRVRYGAFPHFARWLAHFVRFCNESAMRRAAQALHALTSAACDHHLRIARSIGAGHLIRRNGYLWLFRSEMSFAAASLERHILADVGVKAAVVDGAALAELEPAVTGSFARGLFFSDSGSVDDPGQLIESYAAAVRSRRGELHTGEVKALVPAEDSVSLVLDGRRISAERVIIAAGIGSMQLIAPLGYRVPFAAERGYHAHCDPHPHKRLQRPIHDVSGAYVAAPMGSTVRILTGIELARPHDPPDHSQLRAAIAAAREVLPLGAMHAGSEWVGSRPSVADGLPVIGPAPRHPRVLFAFGHGHIGFSTGPVTGAAMADLVTMQATRVPIDEFSIGRFS